MHSDLVILDELGYLPFSASGGTLLFHLLSKLYERTSVVIHILETGNDSFRFKNSSAHEPKSTKEKRKTLTTTTDPNNS
uniref:IstB-like ATP-binding domain-containing protein n=1 Tax=Rhizobium leguminosarum TaxID=384 RepID=A0A154I744_RHILE|nr:hypothetical protein A4A59_35030 [Rhizobium leguminosarum]